MDQKTRRRRRRRRRRRKSDNRGEKDNGFFPMVSVNRFRPNAENKAAKLFNKVGETEVQGTHTARLMLRGRIGRENTRIQRCGEVRKVKLSLRLTN
jgi:hypothetical protein